MLIGGKAVPYELFQNTTDATTALAHKQLILNFAIDVGGYGILSLVIAYQIWKKSSWLAYWIGVIVIGIADLTFLFAMVLSGVIVQNAETIGGPVIWLIAIIITPLGLRPLKK